MQLNATLFKEYFTIQSKKDWSANSIYLANLGRTVTLEDYNENKHTNVQNLQRRLT